MWRKVISVHCSAALLLLQENKLSASGACLTQGTHLTGLQPPTDAVEVESMIAHTCGDAERKKEEAANVGG